MKHLELQKFQNSAFDEFTQKKFIEDQKTIVKLSRRLQEPQNEINFMNDSKDFMDAESCNGNPYATSPPGLCPRHPPFEGMLKPTFISQRQDEEPEFKFFQMEHMEKLPRNQSTCIAEKNGRPKRDSDLRSQSGPSAKDSVIFSGGDSSKNHGADQQRLQISNLHFDKFPTPAAFAC